MDSNIITLNTQKEKEEKEEKKEETKKNINLKNNTRNKTEKHKDTHIKQQTIKRKINMQDIILKKLNEERKKTNIEEKTNVKILKETLKKLTTPFTSRDIKKENDYFNYINFVWLKNEQKTKMQKYLIQFDDTRVIQDKVLYNINDIITDYISSKKTLLSSELKKMYNSAVDLNPLNISKNILSRIINYIDELRKDKKNVWKMLAYANMIEPISFWAPLRWVTNIGEDSSLHESCITTHTFEMIDMSVYIDDGTNIEYKKNYKQQLKKFINSSFKLLVEDSTFNAQDIFDVEFELLNSFICDEAKDILQKGTTKIFEKDSLEKFNFNWKEFAKELGYKKIPKHFTTYNTTYLKCCSTILINNWDNEKWRTYWIWLFVRFIVRVTDNGGSNIYYEYNSNFCRGSTMDLPVIPRSVLFISDAFNTFLSIEYQKKYLNEYYFDYALKMAESIRSTFIKILERNHWLQPKNKLFFIEKIENMKFIIGAVNEYLDADPLLNYKQNELLQNLFKLYNWRRMQFIDKIGYDYRKTSFLPALDWSDSPPKLKFNQSYLVNAQYKPTQNSLIISTGYIQKPFLDLDERGIEYNLAYFGFTVAHELSHALDKKGIFYDKNGNISYDWNGNQINTLNQTETKIYDKIMNNIMSQFKNLYKKDNLDISTIGNIDESFSDISALSICIEYLRTFQEENKLITPICAVSFEEFFIYFSVRMKGKISEKALTAQLRTNPHPLDKYRCNIPLSRSEIFKALYNIKETDEMWWPNQVLW